MQKDDRTHFGLIILGLSIGMGILGDQLLRFPPMGLNASLFSLAVSACIITSVSYRISFHGNWPLILTGPVVIFGLLISWRDSRVVCGLNLFAMILTLTIGMAFVHRKRIISSTISDYFMAMGTSILSAVAGMLMLTASDIRWSSISKGSLPSYSKGFIRGAILASPFALVFGGLLSSADPVFAEYLAIIYRIDFESLVLHTLTIGIITVVLSGYLRGLLYDDETIGPVQRPAVLRLGIVEIGFVVAVVDILFITFVTIQIKYFFGGANHIITTRGLTYSEYARSGFWELVIVSSLVLPMLLVLHWILKKDNPFHEIVFRLLALINVLMLFVIMLSAVQRMRLYVNEYGMTELRFYPTVFMAWLAVVLVWFMVTVLRGRRSRFAFGAFSSALLFILALNIFNPDRFIIEYNIDRLGQGKNFDYRYNLMLSTDAVPSILSRISEFDHSDRKLVSQDLIREYSCLSGRDWRSWNLSQHETKRLIAENQDQLMALSNTESNDY